jgi:predicted outer membrane protein
MTVVPSSFDRTYMEAQVRLHQKAMRAFDELIPQTQGPQLKGLLTYMRQQAERHLSTARSIINSLGA